MPVGRLGADLLVRRPALRAPVLRRPRSVVLVVRDVMSVLVGHDLLRRRLVELIIGSGVDRVGVGVVAGERLVAAVLTRLDGRERHQVQRQQRELRTVWERAEVRRPTLRQRLVDGIAVGDDDVNGGAGGVAGRVRAVPRERGCGKHERDESDEEHLLHGPQTALKSSGAREPPVKVDPMNLVELHMISDSTGETAAAARPGARGAVPGSGVQRDPPSASGDRPPICSSPSSG